MLLLNRGDAAADIEATWEQLGYPSNLPAQVRDLWAHRDLPQATGRFTARVAPHAVVVVKVQP